MPDLTRLGVVGSRKWPDRRFVFGILHALLKTYEVEVIVSGGQPEGVDGWAEDFAESVGLETSIHLPAHWLDKTHPRYAPYSPGNYFARNQLIVEDSTSVVAFCWKGSSGTMDTVGRCTRADIPCRVFTEEDLNSFYQQHEEI